MIPEHEDNFLPLSGIQHYDFCPRQWALIHIEQQWNENILTFTGRQFHERVDDPFFKESRGDRLVTRSLPIASMQLGLYGVADSVEFFRHPKGVSLAGRTGLWMPYPVEYKSGRPKTKHCDRIQLCAQAVCLEETYGLTITEGALFYGRTRQREKVLFDRELRDQTYQLAMEMHDVFRRGITPKVRYFRGCDSCSLKEMCLPKLLNKNIEDYVKSAIRDVQYDA